MLNKILGLISSVQYLKIHKDFFMFSNIDYLCPFCKPNFRFNKFLVGSIKYTFLPCRKTIPKKQDPVNKVCASGPKMRLEQWPFKMF